MTASKDLESLAASFIVDAEDFPYPFRPRDDLDPADQRAGIQDSWHCLETLALTSQTLSARHSRSKVNDLLHAAANAARRMPKLRVLEICEHYLAKYVVVRVCPSGSQFMGRDDKKHSGDRFHYRDMVQVEEMGLNGAHFPASVLRSLWLKDLALHRVSLRQLEIMGDEP
ncbi:hypothetical protein CGLO_04066 [Colletotrichum gloeosporioides Cg-14]|uniref:DUF6546 domain-containing protein n=1 Tax=Colletotrichum gloeosporioides (strain Cg-14) TaxID=1237896 RepID=T0LWA6_COLGC|nr:hypothetical protein CGLO_04066 [Colletotrichum gloeosporioides Cg-14]